ncbi:nucleotidyltransferase family protein [Candidatus Velamenicoccus archaeovorus]|uniref:nucleotidyltransferase family protein n=1 Tax=Velamenicoccus archaeovorus TaxID=1930593 RepID=UPI000FFF4810|nr:nucleotidyltransferase family protein [Candidatus Velamenicoccus archaeovorus]
MKKRPQETSGSLEAIILAAGYATRLYPLTLGIPKPLLRITSDKTVIDLIVDGLVSAGIVRRITVVTNHKFSGDFNAWARRHPHGRLIRIEDDGTLSNEDRLGAIGDIHYVVTKKKIKDDVLVVGGDNLFGRPFDGFIRFARRHRPYASLGLFDIRDKTKAGRFGVVSINRDDRVVRFEEKPERPASTLVATCLYYFPASTLQDLEVYAQDKTTSNDASGNYIRWLMEKGRVYGLVLKQDHWVDIGHLDSYKQVIGRYNGEMT